jgi:hypothetical protein
VEILAQFRTAASGTPLALTSTVANPAPDPLDSRPVCDEWGLYDPEQAGFEAIVRQLPDREEDLLGLQASSLPLTAAASTRSR